MICFVDGKEKNIELSGIFDVGGDNPRVCVISLDELENADIDAEIKQKMLDEFHMGAVSKFENHDTFDFIYISIPQQLAGRDNVSAFAGYLSGRLLLAVYKPWDEYDDISATISGGLSKNLSPARSLLFMLDVFTRKDSQVMQDIEEEITDLEDTLITTYNKDYIKDIVDSRKKLLSLKRYYEQLVDLFDELDENENTFFNASEMKYCGNIAGRVDRLHHTTLNLRDYVTQVREAYQSQVDISLNVIMKVFTVITAIFLPLTLVAGWYGMNLKMPEFDWDYGYPFVISLCVAIVIFCIALFKKNKWF